MRVFITLLGFNTPEMIRGAVENFEATTTDLENRRCIKTIFDCGFPIGNKAENTEKNRQTAIEFGWWHTEIPNESVMGNHNKVIHDFYRMGKGDFYFCFDPDTRMRPTRWMSAMVEALRSEESAVFCASSRSYHDEQWCIDQHGRTIQTLPSGLRISRYRELIAWSSGMWKGEWLAQRPRSFAAEGKVYGWTEHADLKNMQAHGKTWLAVTDFYDDHLSSGTDYTRWKQESAEKKTDKTFEDWLKKH